eukprot:CAMPEP_0194534092 /NCGR_PEP_ID=MMETSP0253-20130528/72142_1 /TAXON_ID=2966 /ORGANISM="Noctiluca scintillans" /LENGTH=294 /DNA_ID=CAMNT_0039379709 /DNA_START=1036 /DNA_END=1919 /DNA_ORIENTATION=-
MLGWLLPKASLWLWASQVTSSVGMGAHELSLPEEAQDVGKLLQSTGAELMDAGQLVSLVPKSLKLSEWAAYDVDGFCVWTEYVRCLCSPDSQTPQSPWDQQNAFDGAAGRRRGLAPLDICGVATAPSRASFTAGAACGITALPATAFLCFRLSGGVGVQTLLQELCWRGSVFRRESKVLVFAADPGLALLGRIVLCKTQAGLFHGMLVVLVGYSVSDLRHRLYPARSPRVQRYGFYHGDVHAHTPMHSATFKTNEDAHIHGCPRGPFRPAVCTLPIIGTFSHLFEEVQVHASFG